MFLLILSVRALRARFRTRELLLIENLALRPQIAALKKQRLRPCSMISTGLSGLLCAPRGPAGRADWSSSTRIPSPSGIEIDCGATGRRSPGRNRAPGGLGWMLRFVAATDFFTVPTASLRML
jgi:hypothetical protein